MADQQWPTGKTLVLRLWSDEEGVLMWKDDFEHVTTIYEAIEMAKTWSEFRARLPMGEFEELMCWATNGGEHIYVDGDEVMFMPAELSLTDFDTDFVIRGDSTFSTPCILGIEDGDYPPDLLMTESVTLPESFVDEFADRAWSFLSGSWNQYPMSRAEEMRQVLAEHGVALEVIDYY